MKLRGHPLPPPDSSVAGKSPPVGDGNVPRLEQTITSPTRLERGRVGESTPRSDAIPKVKGEFVFSNDLETPGMLWGHTLRSPHVHAEIRPGESLLFTLRERLGLPGSKNACEQGECGSCSVLLDGQLVCSCLVLAAQADGHDVVTVEGLGVGEELHPVQQAFVDAGAVQCGFCTPGFVVAAADLLSRNPSPSEDEIREALSGNLCRCTGYQKIVEAVKMAAERA